MCSEVTEVPPGQCMALSCRMVEASAVDAGGVPTMIWPVQHVSNRRGNPTLTSFSFREGGGPCIHTCRAESMHRYRPPCPACGGRCALKGLRPMRAGHAPGSPRCLRVYVRPRSRPRDDRRPRPRPDPTARRARFVLHAPAGVCLQVAYRYGTVALLPLMSELATRFRLLLVTSYIRRKY